MFLIFDRLLYDVGDDDCMNKSKNSFGLYLLHSSTLDRPHWSILHYFFCHEWALLDLTRYRLEYTIRSTYRNVVRPLDGRPGRGQTRSIDDPIENEEV